MYKQVLKQIIQQKSVYANYKHDIDFIETERKNEEKLFKSKSVSMLPMLPMQPLKIPKEDEDVKTLVAELDKSKL